MPDDEKVQPSEGAELVQEEAPEAAAIQAAEQEKLAETSAAVQEPEPKAADEPSEVEEEQEKVESHPRISLLQERGRRFFHKSGKTLSS